VLPRLKFRISNLDSVTRSRSLTEAARFAAFRIHEEASDWLLNIQTSGYVPAATLGYEDTELIEYAPTPYRAIRHCLSRVNIGVGKHTFLDYGVGMGRVVVLAAQQPFARVIGIDLSPLMVQHALRNCERLRKPAQASVEIVLGDAREYQVPADVTVIHLYHPFFGATLEAVVNRIKESLRANPRTITVFYGRPRDFEGIVMGQGWVTRDAFVRFYPNLPYGIYTCRPPRP